MTPLHWAAKNGNCASSFGAMRDEENVKLLLEKGANIEAKDKVVFFFVVLLLSI